MKKKILFISHDASRTGAPIVLLHYLKYLKQKGISIDVLVQRDGPLTVEFNKLGNTIIWKRNFHNKFHRHLLSITRILSRTKQSWEEKLVKKIGPRYDVIYANTVASLSTGLIFKKLFPNCKLICHVHELEMAIDQYFGKDNFTKAVDYIDAFIAVSESVRSNLVTNYKIPHNKIELIYECVPARELSDRVNTVKRIALNHLFEVEPKFLIVGSGSTDWRKGIDLFIQIAKLTAIRNPKASLKFLWVGGFPGIDLERAKYDIAKLNLQQTVAITGVIDNSEDYLALADIFLLTSREDPFPLVALEAGALAKPIICFQGGGGIPEFITDDRGWTIPYGDISKACELIEMCAQDESRVLLSNKGKEIRQHVCGNYDIEQSATNLLRFLYTVA